MSRRTEIVRIFLVIVVVVVGWASFGAADESPPRLLSGSGLAIPPDAASASVPAEKLPTEIPGKAKPLGALVRGVLRTADGIIAAPAPTSGPAATQRATTQSAAITDVQRNKLTALARRLVGMPIEGEFVVDDVVEFPAATQPATTQSGATETTIFLPSGRFIAVCRFTVGGPDRFTREEQAEVKKIQDDWRAQAKQMTDRAADRRQARQMQIESEKRLKQVVADHRRRAAQRRPTHYAYFTGDDATLAAWRAGETRTAQGVVQSAVLSVVTIADRDGPQPAVDVVVRLLPATDDVTVVEKDDVARQKNP